MPMPRGYKFSPESKAKIGKRSKMFMNRPEIKEFYRKKMKAFWENNREFMLSSQKAYYDSRK